MEKVQISNYKGHILMNRKKQVRRSNFRERAIQVQKMGGRGDYRWTKSSWDKMNTTIVPLGQIGFYLSVLTRTLMGRKYSTK